MRFKLLAALVIVVLIGIYGLIKVSSVSKPIDDQKKLKVTASFYPLYYFASQIGGDKAKVINITPAGAEPHDYEPSTQDISNINKSNLVIINGAVESWGDKIKDDLKARNINFVIASKGLITQQVEEEGKMINDPHVWLDPVLAQKEVETILQAFVAADKSNQMFYENNTRELTKNLETLDSEFKQGLVDCKQKNIVTSHAAFGYLALRYGLKQIPISGLSPDEEPSPKKLAETAAFVKANQIKYIFFETLVSPRLADTIAKETGAKTLVFNPLEGLTKEEEAAGKDYFSIQRENLANLKIGLECI